MKTFQTICSENYTRIYRYVYIMTKDQTSAEDITQEVFLTAYKKGNAFLQHPSPEGFLCKTAKYITYDSIRNNARRMEEPLDENRAVAEGDLLDELYSLKSMAFDESQLIPKVLNALTTEERELYHLFYVERHSIKEIAESLHLGESAVKMRYFRLRHKIKKIVSDLNLDDLVMKGREQHV